VHAGYWFEQPSNSTYLDYDTYNSFVASQPEVVAQFFNPGCGYSRSFNPEWERAIVHARGLGMASTAFVRVNCDDERELYEAYSISMFPTFKFYKGGVEVGEFVGTPLTGEALVAEVRELFLAATDVLCRGNVYVWQGWGAVP
jgi:thiol-disulfide isomerase/thioredoxin